MSKLSLTQPVQAALILAVSVLAIVGSICWAIQCRYTVTVEMTLPNQIHIEGKPN